MKMSRIAAVVTFLASATVFANPSAFTAVSSDQEHRQLIETPKGGPGPACLPGDPCGWPPLSQKFDGPVCVPGDPCGWPPISVKFEKPMCLQGIECLLAAKDGPGPACWPGIGCPLDLKP